MAIPVQFQQFKSAGIYRVVYDKSTVLGTEAELLRLVVGYSPKGPFNTPVYIKSVSDFKAMYGDISKSLEKRGCFFHRTCIQALEAGPILCLNLKKFEEETVGALRMADGFDNSTPFNVKEIYDTTRFWRLEPENLNTGYSYLTISATDSKETSGTVFVRKAANSLVKEYNISVGDWYKSYGEDIPDYLVGYESTKLSEFFAEVFVFKGQFTRDQILASNALRRYFTNNYYVVHTEDATDPSTTVTFAPTAKMDGSNIVAGESKYYVTSTLREMPNGERMGIPTRVKVTPTVYTLEGDSYSVPASKITWVEKDGVGDFYYIPSLGPNSSILEDSITAEFALGIGEDDKMYAYNQIVRSGKEFYTADSIICTNIEDPTTFFAPSMQANPGDPMFAAYEMDEEGNYKTLANTAGQIVVVDKVENAFGEYVDGLESLYNESSSGAVARYIGCILPNFIDNNSGYKSLDILFNLDSDIHHMMMGLDENMLLDDGAVGNYVLSNVALKNDVANRTPWFINGYSYENYAKPKGASITAKREWQDAILSVLKDEVGLRRALLSSAEIEYRYIVDSFETYYKFGDELKSSLSLLAKDKELCFSILNFPSVQSMSKEPTFINAKTGVFDVSKMVATTLLPSESNGASFCAFYTPLKFSDGYVDTIVPSAGLVSNLFIAKYNGRSPYSIIAGPNYANVQYTQLVGPDYHYSQEELHVIEPFGVNCMIYRPTFGTFINANQTAKQTPKSALSAVNVRELVIYLQDEIGKILQAYQWEFNNPTTREAIKSRADLVCESAKRNGGIQAYLNVMDESNNTKDIIDNEMCVLSTSIEPGRGAGKMIHELTIYRTGGMSSLIKEA